MEFSENPETLKQWIPLMLRIDLDEPIAATKIDSGTDVNFGALTRMLVEHLTNKDVAVNYKHQLKILIVQKKVNGK